MPLSPRNRKLGFGKDELHSGVVHLLVCCRPRSLSSGTEVHIRRQLFVQDNVLVLPDEVVCVEVIAVRPLNVLTLRWNVHSLPSSDIFPVPCNGGKEREAVLRESHERCARDAEEVAAIRNVRGRSGAGCRRTRLCRQASEWSGALRAAYRTRTAARLMLPSPQGRVTLQ